MPSVLNWIGLPNDHFKGNEPSHIAAHLVRGEGFASPFTDLPIPTAQQPPIYPLFIAAIFRIFGVFSRASLYVILVANCVAGGLTGLFIYRAGVKHSSLQVALLSGWAWSLFAPIAITDLTLSSYSFATLAVVLWLNFVPFLAPKIGNWILLGIAVGFMGLLNPMLFSLIPASLYWFKKKQVALIMILALLCITPWYVRNYKVLGHFYPALRDNFGMELYYGNHPGMSGTSDYGTGEPPFGSEFPMGEVEFFEARQRDAVAYIKARPMQFALRTAKRFARFWLSPWPAAYVVLLILAIFGLRFVPRPFSTFTITLFISYPLVFYITQVAWPTAYRHPIEPLILLMASQSICRLLRTRARFGEPNRQLLA